MKTVAEWLSTAIDELRDLGGDEARLSSEVLLGELLGLNRTALYLEGAKQVSSELADQFQKQLELRKRRTPLAYILGKSFFWNECLKVGPGCLIPRPETEILIEQVIALINDPTASFTFIDIGTGSGAIAIALLRHFPKSHAALIDSSAAALSYARENAAQYGLSDRVEFIHSDCFSFFAQTGKKWDWVLSNPPYLSHKDLLELQPELKYEPLQALDGGPEGLSFYQKLFAAVPLILKAGGWMAVEMGIGQSEVLQQEAKKFNFHNLHIAPDYSGIDRVLMAEVGF